MSKSEHIAEDERQKKILAVAYSCAPNRGSEPGIGWNFLNQIARKHQVWALVGEHYSQEIHEYLDGKEVSNLTLVFCKVPVLQRVYRRFPNSIVTTLYYYVWQWMIRKQIDQLHSDIGFDLVHHITFGKYNVPSWLGRLKIPFIFGPVGGGEETPSPLYRELRWQSRVSETVRSAFCRWAGVDPFVRRTVRSATVCLATSNETASKLRALGAGDIRLLTHVGISESEIDAVPKKRFEESSGVEGDPSQLKILCVGRLLYWKGFELVVRAIGKLGNTNVTLSIVGSGPQFDELTKLAKELGVDDSVEFCGELSRSQTLEKMSASDLLAHPSYHDSGGFVLVEAMAIGLPVLCIDTGGPGFIVSEETGFKLAPKKSDILVEEMAQLLHELSHDKSRLHTKGRAAQMVLERGSLNWRNKGDRILEIVDEVTAAPTVA